MSKIPRGSRLFAWVVFMTGAGLSFYLKDSTYFAISTPSSIGLYINKQHTEKKKDESIKES